MKRAVYIVFFLAIAACVYLLVGPSPFVSKEEKRNSSARTIIPRSEGTAAQGMNGATENAEQLAFEDSATAKISLGPDEIPVAVLTIDADGDSVDEQFIAIKTMDQEDQAITLLYVDFDESSGGYRRMWKAPTGATRSRTFNLTSKDVIGDRSVCVVASGMNDAGEQTLTILRLPPSDEPQVLEEPGIPQADRVMTGDQEETVLPFEIIADIKADGSISLQETPRSEAYQLGMAKGDSFPIAVYERDLGSSNLLDQIETSFRYDPFTKKYERSSVARIPGAQIEQRRVRELLDGKGERFEEFLDGLWYSSSQVESVDGVAGTRYILFDRQRREITFYIGDIQEVFSWPSSAPTRYGLYISAQNISVATLKRIVDIELEGSESIKLKTFEDVRLKIGISGRWDGSYRKLAGERTPRRDGSLEETDQEILGTWVGDTSSAAQTRVLLSKDSSFEASIGTAPQKGRYGLFKLDDLIILELRPTAAQRVTYSVILGKKGGGDTLTLQEVRLGIRGAERTPDDEIVLSRKEKSAGQTEADSGSAAQKTQP